MGSHGPMAAAVGAMLAFSARAAIACEPASLASDRSRLPAVWASALEALVDATGREGQPWSCPGQAVTIDLKPGWQGATLTIEGAGGLVSRDVADPGELEATGKALLAATMPRLAQSAPRGDPALVASASAEPVQHPSLAPAPPPDATTPPPPPAPPSERIRIDALSGARTSGPDSTQWISVKGSGILPFGPMIAGLWARIDIPVAVANPPPNFHMHAISIGASLGPDLRIGRFDLGATFDPSIATVAMESRIKPHDDSPEGAAVALRLGGTVRGGFAINRTFRGLVAVDGEFAPEFVGSPKTIAGNLPTVPVFTAGVSLGVEASIR